MWLQVFHEQERKKEVKDIEEIVPEMSENSIETEDKEATLSPELTRIIELEEELERVKKEADEEKNEFYA